MQFHIRMSHTKVLYLDRHGYGTTGMETLKNKIYAGHQTTKTIQE